MPDERPRPRYGEYAPVPPAPPAEVVPTPVAQEAVTSPDAPPRPTRPADIFLTTMLLLLGVADVVTGFSQFNSLGDSLRTLYAAQGLPAFTSDDLANSAGFAINIARVAILVVAIVVSLRLVSLHRRAFWVPLAGAVLAAVVVIVCVFVVILHDPAFAQYVATQSTAG